MVTENGGNEVKCFILFLEELGKKEWKKERDLRERTTIFIAFGPKCPWYVEIMAGMYGWIMEDRER